MKKSWKLKKRYIENIILNYRESEAGEEQIASLEKLWHLNINKKKLEEKQYRQ
ncbi:hypothetical protein [Nostoc sp.]|uniref:hypothetical protein n=1 Tax=Nostoc sp. TaxID=1180 RepID=UPI002FF7C58C